MASLSGEGHVCTRQRGTVSFGAGSKWDEPWEVRRSKTPPSSVTVHRGLLKSSDTYLTREPKFGYLTCRRHQQTSIKTILPFLFYKSIKGNSEKSTYKLCQRRKRSKNMTILTSLGAEGQAGLVVVENTLNWIWHWLWFRLDLNFYIWNWILITGMGLLFQQNAAEEL